MCWCAGGGKDTKSVLYVTIFASGTEFECCWSKSDLLITYLCNLATNSMDLTRKYCESKVPRRTLLCWGVQVYTARSCYQTQCHSEYASIPRWLFKSTLWFIACFVLPRSSFLYTQKPPFAPSGTFLDCDSETLSERTCPRLGYTWRFLVKMNLTRSCISSKLYVLLERGCTYWLHCHDTSYSYITHEFALRQLYRCPTPSITSSGTAQTSYSS